MSLPKPGRHRRRHRSPKPPKTTEETGLEEHFILRLPNEDAGELRKLLEENSKKISKLVKLDMDPETHYGQIELNNKCIPLKLMDLPTIIESNKSIDKKAVYKTADIHQIMLPYDIQEEEEMEKNTDKEKGKKKFQYPHGITPPMRNVQKHRFRKEIKNPHHKELNLDDPEVKKELRWLLRMDSEAIAVRCDLIMDEKKVVPKVEAQDSDEAPIIDEKDVFGSIISDSNEESDEAEA